MFYELLMESYKPNEPILKATFTPKYRRQIDILHEDGLLKCFSAKEGVYYYSPIDEKEYDSITVEKVIDAFFVNTKESYKDEDGKLKIKEQVIGYYTDATFAEQIGINYQPDFFAVTSIKGKSRHGDLKHFCGEEIVIKKSYVTINEENQKILQLMDLIIQLEDCKYCTEDNWVQIILEYMKQEGISFSDMNKYIFCYPSYYQRAFLNNKIKREERLRRKYIMPGTKWSTFHKV